jgi:hypothetical protein
MPGLKLAHIREQGQDMIIFPLDHRFGQLSQQEQQEELQGLENRAHAAGLAGHAIAIWDAGGGRARFIGPRQWHAFLQGKSLRWVLANLNKQISWT